MKRVWPQLDGGSEDQGGADVYLNAETKNFISSGSDWLQSWGDPINSVNRVLKHINSGDDVNCVYLKDCINKKFVSFYEDITEECGLEDKQHSWGILEKPEEVIMYGPFYPNYNNGQHSEDTVIKQTDELLVSEDVSKDCCVYIFTLNSPCLSRNIGPCMLNLMQKAVEWYTQYGVRTYIGYKKCWGFRGNKEILYRDICYAQFELLSVSHNHDNYMNRVKNCPRKNLFPLSEIQFMVIKRWLSQEDINFKFSLDPITPEQRRKTYLKNMHIGSASGLPDERELFIKEVTNMLEAVHPNLVNKTECLEEYLEIGKAFAHDYNFDTEICYAKCTELRTSFEQCWKDTVQNKYAELLRERLIEYFNKGVIQLFLNDVTALKKEYIQIGQIK